MLGYGEGLGASRWTVARGPVGEGPLSPYIPTRSSHEKRRSQGGSMLVRVLVLTCMACWNR